MLHANTIILHVDIDKSHVNMTSNIRSIFFYMLTCIFSMLLAEDCVTTLVWLRHTGHFTTTPATRFLPANSQTLLASFCVRTRSQWHGGSKVHVELRMSLIRGAGSLTGVHYKRAKVSTGLRATTIFHRKQKTHWRFKII